MSIDSAITIAWDVFKSVVAPIKRQFGYVIYSKRHADDLQEKVRELANEVDRVYILAQRARNNVRIFYGEFTEWEASAGKDLKEAQDLLRDFQQARKTCCYETLPDPKCRYQFSRKAKDKIEVIQRLTQRCSGFKELNDISSSNPASGNVAALTSAKREGISSSNPAPGNIAALPPAKREGISSSNPAPGNVAALTPAKREGISSSNPAPGNVAALTPSKREGKDVVQSVTVTASPSFASTMNKVGDNDVFESRASIMRDIMDALADASNRVVGVHGMGGVGKSTLLADVERRIIEKKSFDWVTKADVSENPDIKKIQGEIADALDLTDIKKKETNSGRAKLLHERLENEEREKKKVLIILDNLWKGLDLKSVGIPCGHDNKVIGCKLLLTSRFQDVLRREMGCDKDFRLEELKDEEAKRLFERTVGDKVHDDPFKSLVDEALHKCAGLPFLIIAMANIFKDAQFLEWKDVFRQIEMSTNKGISRTINEMLQLSYDHLRGEDSKELKSLLRLCVVYGVSKPSLENLVRYGVGLRLFREDCTMEENRYRINRLIRKLKAASLLLEDNEDVGDFKIHDLVRGFVASVASRDDPFLVLKDNVKSVTELPKDKLRSCTAVCFPYVDMKEFPEELDCPEMQIFLLFTNNEYLKVPNSYFNSMKKLTVLHLSQVCLTSSPSPFQFLANLHTLCLDDCSLEDVAMIGMLKGLQILSFAHSKIQRLPEEIGQLVELRLLDLNHCTLLKIIEPSVLGNLMKLEELFMENSFDRWNAMDAVEQTSSTNARLIELNDMKNLCTLHVSILDPNVLPEDLNVKKLTKHKIKIGDAGCWQSDKGSSTLKLKLNPASDILQKGCIQTLLGKTDDLFLDGLSRIEQSIGVLSQEGFPKLKHLHVENSPSIHYVLQSPSLTDFKMLESLILNNLINLEKICNRHISSESFSALKVVRVKSCNKMEVLFPLSLLRELPKLEEIQAIWCPLMLGIVEVDDCDKVELRNLHVLELHGLPNVKNFFTPKTAPSSSASKDQVVTQVTFFNGQQVSIPSLESLKMVGLPNLEYIWSNESLLGLINLQFLEVSSCKSLSKVINSKSLVKLHKLHTLRVEACILVQEIFDLDGLSANANIETLSELNTIHIMGLLGLRHIWNKNPHGIVRLHNLKEVRVHGCDNLRFMFFQSMVQYLAQLRELEVQDCKKMEAIIMEEEGLNIETSETLVFPMLTVLKFVRLESLTCFSRRKCTSEARGEDYIKSRSTILFNQEVVFPSLEALHISGMGYIKMIWDNHVAFSCPRCFQYLKTLDVSYCDELSNMFTSITVGNLVELTKLRISNCYKLTEVISDGGGKEGPVVAFKQLKYIQLEELRGLTCFSSGRHILMFPLLEDIIVIGCHNIKFFSKAPIRAPKLKKVQGSTGTWFCNGNINNTIQKIAMDDGVEFMHLYQAKGHSDLISIKPSRQLKSLVVDGCSFFNAIPSGLMGELDNISTLRVQDCEQLEEIFGLEILAAKKITQGLPQLCALNLVNLPKLRQLWNKDFQGTLCFNSLSCLILCKCNNLRYVFTPSMARCLPMLQWMEIKECDQMKEVIREEKGERSAVEKITFPILRWIELECLPNMTDFPFRMNHALECPVLQELTIARCPKMITFAWQSLKKIDQGIPSPFTPQVIFPCLKSMVLSHMDSSSKIWVHSSQHSRKVEALDKLQVEFCEIKESGLPNVTSYATTQDLPAQLAILEGNVSDSIN